MASAPLACFKPARKIKIMAKIMTEACLSVIFSLEQNSFIVNINIIVSLVNA
jgi:hypothetical protein